MNLAFQEVKGVRVNGDIYTLERADVTDVSEFWAAWNYDRRCKEKARQLNADFNGAETLESLVSLSREDVHGCPRWFAYRLVQNGASGVSFGTFTLGFVLRDARQLFEYQIPAVTHLCNAIVSHGAAADGSDTGLGKTFMGLSVCRNLKLSPLVVCRKAGLATWERACRFMEVRPVDIVNWESAKSDMYSYTKRTAHPYNGRWMYRWDIPKNTLLIFDEAHMGNHHDSQNSAMWCASRPYMSLSLSATFADTPARLRPLFEVLGGELPTGDAFVNWLHDRGQFVNRYNEHESLCPIRDMKIVNRMIFPHHGYRLSYDDPRVRKFFPERVYQTEIVSLSAKNQEKQNRLYRELLEKVAKYRALKQTANALVADLRYRQMAELLKADVLCDLAVNYIMQGRSVCIFVNFRETLRYCSRKLKTESLIFGNQHREVRQEVIDAFQEDRSRILIAMVDAGGQSISLHDLRGRFPRISLVCPTYNPISLRQVLGRTFRAGTKSTPIMKLVYAANTVEEKVAMVVNAKLDNIAALNDGDLMEPDLFGLLRPQDRKVES